MNGYQIVPESVLSRNAEKLSKLQQYVQKNMINRPFHNYSHAEDAANSYALIGEKEGLTPYEMFLGVSTMTAHDLISIPGVTDNEERTIQALREILPSMGYLPEEINTISQIIYPTKVGIEPKCLIEMIAKDSDLGNLGRNDFFEKTESLRNELGVQNQLKWYNQTLKFMQIHRYYTNAAKNLYGKKKDENMRSLDNLIQSTLDLIPSRSIELLGD